MQILLLLKQDSLQSTGRCSTLAYNLAEPLLLRLRALRGLLGGCPGLWGPLGDTMSVTNAQATQQLLAPTFGPNQAKQVPKLHPRPGARFTPLHPPTSVLSSLQREQPFPTTLRQKVGLRSASDWGQILVLQRPPSL